MKVLLTGATGFLGKYIYNALNKEMSVITMARSNGDFNIDLSANVPNDLPEIDIVIHNAGKAHSVPKTEAEQQEFYDVNIQGTKNLLEALSKYKSLPKSFVFISSVAVYGLIEGLNINENSPLMATDAYGKSKIEAESLVQAWCDKNNVICTILRLPLLVGENPPGNLGAMIKGIKQGYYFNIAGGLAKKSMVLAEDVAAHIPTVAEIGGVYNLTDGYHPNFKELSIEISSQLKKQRILSLPLLCANWLGKIGDLLGNHAPINTLKVKKITSNLTFDDSKARRSFNWKPKLVLSEIKVY